VAHVQLIQEGIVWSYRIDEVAVERLGQECRRWPATLIGHWNVNRRLTRSSCRCHRDDEHLAHRREVLVAHLVGAFARWARLQLRGATQVNSAGHVLDGRHRDCFPHSATDYVAI